MGKINECNKILRVGVLTFMRVGLTPILRVGLMPTLRVGLTPTHAVGLKHATPDKLIISFFDPDLIHSISVNNQ